MALRMAHTAGFAGALAVFLWSMGLGSAQDSGFDVHVEQEAAASEEVRFFFVGGSDGIRIRHESAWFSCCC